jgi:hypothetical protein
MKFDCSYEDAAVKGCTVEGKVHYTGNTNPITGALIRPATGTTTITATVVLYGFKR